MSAAERAVAEQDRRYNAATTDLDRAIRLLNRASEEEKRGRLVSADSNRIFAARILERIGPEKLIVDPDVIL